MRNEEQRLQAAVESVRAVADEVVVTDTGSTDGTVALAERLGARVNHFAWCDDFAAARNAGAEHARGEWILWLDADERLKLPEGGVESLRRELSDPKAVAYQVIREDFFSAERPDWFTEMYQMRLVRRDQPLKFVGRIHEHLTPWPVDFALRTGRKVGVSSARLVHWGYTNEQLPAKFARAARLCELELQERPGQLYYLVELARANFALSTAESRSKGAVALMQAVQVMMASRDAPQAPTPLAAGLIEQLLAMPGQRLVSEDDLMTLSARWFPRNPPLLWATARTLCGRSAWGEAERILRRLLELLESRSYDRYGSFDPRIEEDARFNLGVCLVRQARLEEAQTLFTKLLQSPRRAGEARANLEAIAGLRARFGQ